jgi:restriction system protein
VSSLSANVRVIAIVWQHAERARTFGLRSPISADVVYNGGMAIPDYEGLMLPLLESLRDGAEHAVRDVRDEIAERLRLTDGERTEMLPSGKQPVFDNRIGWAKTYLDRAGLVSAPKRGIYKITDLGRQVLASKPRRVDVAFLTQYPQFQEFYKKRPQGPPEDGTPVSPAAPTAKTTPREKLEGAVQQMRRELESELLETVLRASPQFFERLVVDLLEKMGYGGWIKGAGRVTGRAGDGGIDGVIKQDHFGLDAIYVQAKRWQGAVGRPEIQKFSGSLDTWHARKGVFITTSTFTDDALEYVRKIEKKIVLVDGQKLAELMVDFDVGVNLTDTYKIKRVDTDYFSEE